MTFETSGVAGCEHEEHSPAGHPLITGEGWDAPSLGRLFDVIQSVADERTFVVFPVIRELENPELMKVLDERLKAVKYGTAETVPWDEVMKKLRARAKKTRKNPSPH